MDEVGRFISGTEHISNTEFEHSDSECFSCDTTSTDSTTLRRRNRSLRLAIQSLKNTINLLTSGTIQYMDNYVEVLDKKIDLEKLKSKSQMRNFENLLRDTTNFLTDSVKEMRKTMLEHRVKTEQVLDQVEHLLNGVEYQKEPNNFEFQTVCSPVKDLNLSRVNVDQWKCERFESTTASTQTLPLDPENVNTQSYSLRKYLDTVEQQKDPGAFSQSDLHLLCTEKLRPASQHLQIPTRRLVQEYLATPSAELSENIQDYNLNQSPINLDQWRSRFGRNWVDPTAVQLPQISHLDPEDVNIQLDILVENLDTEEQQNDPGAFIPAALHLPCKENIRPASQPLQIPTRPPGQEPSSTPSEELSLNLSTVNLVRGNVAWSDPSPQISPLDPEDVNIKSYSLVKYLEELQKDSRAS